MASFSETLHEIRLKRKYTQEQLAQELNVSRQTISHWENGRAVPDIDTIKRLSQVLDYNFLAITDNDAETEAVPAAEAPETETPAAETPAAESSAVCAPAIPALFGRVWFWGALTVAILAVAVVFVCLPKFRQPSEPAAPLTTPVPPGDYARYSYEWFRQTQEPVEGQAYVRLVPRENPTHPSGGTYWCYEFDIYFDGDADFIVENVYYHHFYMGYARDEVRIINKEGFVAGYGTDTFKSGSCTLWRGGCPVQDISIIGITLEGTDINGKDLLFTGYVNLSRELRD